MAGYGETGRQFIELTSGQAATSTDAEYVSQEQCLVYRAKRYWLYRYEFRNK